jgi:hypothetical protein
MRNQTAVGCSTPINGKDAIVCAGTSELTDHVGRREPAKSTAYRNQSKYSRNTAHRKAIAPCLIIQSSVRFAIVRS